MPQFPRTLGLPLTINLLAQNTAKATNLDVSQPVEQGLVEAPIQTIPEVLESNRSHALFRAPSFKDDAFAKDIHHTFKFSNWASKDNFKKLALTIFDVKVPETARSVLLAIDDLGLTTHSMLKDLVNHLQIVTGDVSADEAVIIKSSVDATKAELLAPQESVKAKTKSAAAATLRDLIDEELDDSFLSEPRPKKDTPEKALLRKKFLAIEDSDDADSDVKEVAPKIKAVQVAEEKPQRKPIAQVSVEKPAPVTLPANIVNADATQNSSAKNVASILRSLGVSQNDIKEIATTIFEIIVMQARYKPETLFDFFKVYGQPLIVALKAEVVKIDHIDSAMSIYFSFKSTQALFGILQNSRQQDFVIKNPNAFETLNAEIKRVLGKKDSLQEKIELLLPFECRKEFKILNIKKLTRLRFLADTEFASEVKKIIKPLLPANTTAQQFEAHIQNIRYYLKFRLG